MPRYVFKCPRGHVAEETRRVDERDAPKECPHCAGRVYMKRTVAPTSGLFPGADTWRKR